MILTIDVYRACMIKYLEAVYIGDLQNINKITNEIVYLQILMKISKIMWYI